MAYWPEYHTREREEVPKGLTSGIFHWIIRSQNILCKENGKTDDRRIHSKSQSGAWG